MKVRVTKCDGKSRQSSTPWYVDHIGEVFEVSDKPDYLGIYRINHNVEGHSYMGKGIFDCDCKKVEEFKLDDGLFEI
jgi:hypothetical protein